MSCVAPTPAAIGRPAINPRLVAVAVVVPRFILPDPRREDTGQATVRCGEVRTAQTARIAWSAQFHEIRSSAHSA
jgi:hypothetical protein